MTLNDLRAIPAPSPLPLLNLTRRASNYALLQVNGEDNLNNCVDHTARVIMLERWCADKNLAALAVVAHECAHVTQVNSFYLNLHIRYSNKTTKYLIEKDANKRAIILLKNYIDKPQLALITQFYKAQLKGYFSQILQS